MDITYSFAQKDVSFTSKPEDKLHSYVLTNERGDFICQSLQQGVCKSFGYFLRQNKESVLKVIDFIGPLNLKAKKVDIKEFSVTKEFSSPYVEHDEDLGYEKVCISPIGGVLYEVRVDSPIVIDLDVKVFNDYSKFGKEYNIYEEQGVLFIEFCKRDDSGKELYRCYIGIKTQNLIYTKREEWIKKEYSYDLLRGVDFEEFVFRALEIDILNTHKKFAIGYSTSKEEVFTQLLFLENFNGVIEKVEDDIDRYSFEKTQSSTPLSIQRTLGYDVAKRNFFDFVVKSDTNSSLLCAGFPWFYQEWIRDELFSLRALLDLKRYDIVKSKLLELCLKIDDNGEIERINATGSLKSFDSIVLLAKRIEDFIFAVDNDREVSYSHYVNDEVLEVFYESLERGFKGIMGMRWNVDIGFVNISKGEWWRDTIDWIEYPLGLQLGIVNLISVLAVLSKLVNKSVKCQEYLDFESVYVEHIKEKYIREDQLFDELHQDTVTCDIFLGYYLYPDLCTQSEWERYLEKALQHLYLQWGGVSSLSKFDSRFCDTYSGANDVSYHQGDSWYVMNAICAIVLHHCNSKKFKNEISKISEQMTQELLFKGAFGHIAEVSSSKEARSYGCVAQSWSLALYIEMCHNIYFEK